MVYILSQRVLGGEGSWVMTANLKSCMRPERKTSGLYSSPSSGFRRERYLEGNGVT